MFTLSVSVPTVLIPTQVYTPLSLTVKLVISSSPSVLIIVLLCIHYKTHQLVGGNSVKVCTCIEGVGNHLLHTGMRSPHCHIVLLCLDLLSLSVELNLLQ